MPILHSLACTDCCLHTCLIVCLSLGLHTVAGRPCRRYPTLPVSASSQSFLRCQTQPRQRARLARLWLCQVEAAPECHRTPSLLTFAVDSRLPANWGRGTSWCFASRRVHLWAL